MLRKIGGVVAGVVAWFLIAGTGNHILRAMWPGYSQAEIAMTFTREMLIVRLFIAAISSLCAGFFAAWITNRSVLAMKIPCRRLAYHAAPRDHFVGTLFTLVSSVFSYVASGADATWRLALSSRGEPTQSNEFSVVRWQPWPFHPKPSR
jgi:hypothetical protein